MQGGSEPHPSGHILEVGRRQKNTSDALLGHCLHQTGLLLHCVWHSVDNQSTTTEQHPKLRVTLCMNVTEPLEMYMSPGHMGKGTAAIGLKIEVVMAFAEINAKLVFPMRISSFPPAFQHGYNAKRHNLIAGVSNVRFP